MMMLDPVFLSEARPSFSHSTFPASTDSRLFQIQGGPTSVPSRGSTDSPSNVDGDFHASCLSSSSLSGMPSSLPTSSLSTPQHYSNIILKMEDDRDSIPSSVSHTDSADPGGYVCQDCGGIFPDRSVLSRHRISHSVTKYVCPMCSRPFARDDKLKRHIRCVHSSERPFKCEICSKAFARKDKLQEHARHHNRDITFTCSICSEVFVMRSHLNRHLRGVHKMKLFTSNPVAENANSNVKTTFLGSKSAFTPVNNGFPTDSLSGVASVLTPISTNVSDKSSKPRRRSTTQRFCPTKGNAADVMKSPHPSLYMHPNSLSTFSIPSSPGSEASLFFGFSPLSTNPTSSLTSTLQVRGGAQHMAPASSPSCRFPAHSGGEVLYRNQLASQMYSQQQLTPPPQSAWSAAVAASLFRPVNYAGWWPQANANFMLPYGYTGVTQSTERPSSEPSASSVSSYPHMTDAISPNTGLQSEGSQSSDPNSSIPNTSSSSYNLYSGVSGGGISEGGNSGTGFGGSVNAPAHMLASLPTFAQAMYYQAASWVANQNGDTQGNGAFESSSAPRFPTPYFSVVPTPHNH